jgi:hypothetical protein
LATGVFLPISLRSVFWFVLRSVFGWQVNDIQIDNDLNSQPEPSVNTTNTSKRFPTESSDQLPATQKQILRQTRKRISEILVRRPPSPREIQMLQIKSLRRTQAQQCSCIRILIQCRALE